MIDYNPVEYVTYQVYRRNTGEYVLVFYREDGCPYCGYKGCLSDIEQDVEGNVYVPEN